MRIAAALTFVFLIVSAGNGARAAASLHILAPKDGASVRSPLTVSIEPTAHDHGHAHLIIDSPLPAPGAMIPMDSRHVHLMQGETEMTLELPPGTHTLQLIVAGHDHRVPPHAAQSARVTIHVR